MNQVFLLTILFSLEFIPGVFAQENRVLYVELLTPEGKIGYLEQ